MTRTLLNFLFFFFFLSNHHCSCKIHGYTTYHDKLLGRKNDYYCCSWLVSFRLPIINKKKKKNFFFGEKKKKKKKKERRKNSWKGKIQLHNVTCNSNN